MSYLAGGQEQDDDRQQGNEWSRNNPGLPFHSQYVFGFMTKFDESDGVPRPFLMCSPATYIKGMVSCGFGMVNFVLRMFVRQLEIF